MSELVAKTRRRRLLVRRTFASVIGLLLLGSSFSEAAPAAAPILRTARPVGGIDFPKAYFGLHVIDNDGSAEWPPAGYGGIRLLGDNYVSWSKLEPAAGEWSFVDLDRLVGQAEAHGVQVLLVLGQTPAWASTRPNESAPYSAGSAAEPRNIEDWRLYVRTVATRYKGRIGAYEIWNEPNTWFWSGSLSTLVNLEREAYQILKSVDPQATVVSAGLSNTNRATVDRFLDAGVGKYADVIGYHFYTQTAAPEAMLTSIQMVRNALTAHGLGTKPIWNTETGWLIPEDSGDFPDQRAAKQWKSWKHLTPELGAAYVARALVLARIGAPGFSGVDRFYWYGWDHGALGLTSNSGHQRREAATGYLATIQWLTGSRTTGCDSDANNVWTCPLTRGNRTAWLVWSASGTGAVPAEVRKQSAGLERLLTSNQVEDISDRDRVVGETPVLFLGQKAAW